MPSQLFAGLEILALYDRLLEARVLSKGMLAQGEGDRTHAEIQAWLRDLGKALGYDVWIAANDRGRLYDGEPPGRTCLEHLPMPIATASGADAIRLIDVLWLEPGGSNVIVAFDVEHSTLIYSGIVRMLDLALSGGEVHAAAGLILIATDSREADVRADCSTRLQQDRRSRYLLFAIQRTGAESRSDWAIWIGIEGYSGDCAPANVTGAVPIGQRGM